MGSSAKFYALLCQYRMTDSTPQWILDPPFWLQDDFDFKSGQRQAEKWNPRTFVFARTEPEGELVKPDFPSVVGTGESHIASIALANAINEVASGCVEFLPVRTRTSIGEDITEGYFMMNYLNWLDAVDRKHSTWSDCKPKYKRAAVINGDFYHLEEVVLSRKKLVYPICRVSGWSPYYIYREDVVAHLTSRGLTGLEFEVIAMA